MSKRNPVFPAGRQALYEKYRKRTTRNDVRAAAG
jgi:hypothetical protein